LVTRFRQLGAKECLPLAFASLLVASASVFIYIERQSYVQADTDDNESQSLSPPRISKDLLSEAPWGVVATLAAAFSIPLILMYCELRPRPDYSGLSEAGMQLVKMRRNQLKAMQERERRYHQETETSEYSVPLRATTSDLFRYFRFDQVAYCIYQNPYASIHAVKGMQSLKLQRITTTHSFYTVQGQRSVNQDRLLCMELPRWVVVGVLDGHGGGQVAPFARDKLEEFFKTRMSEEGEINVYDLFKEAMGYIHEAIRKESNGYKDGSTIALAVIDKELGTVFALSLGDTESLLYRNIQQRTQAIALTCVRDWESPKDAARMNAIIERCLDPGLKREKVGSKTRFLGYNVSRGIGDMDVASYSGLPALSRKPKISIFESLQGGDTLLLFSDGLRDDQSEHNIIEAIDTCNDCAFLAKKIIFHGDKQENSYRDNTTVVAVRINTAS